MIKIILISICLFPLLCIQQVHGQESVSYIKIASIGPRNVFVYPMIITKDSLDSIEKLTFSVEKKAKMSLAYKMVFETGTLIVSPIVYNYLNEYFESNKLNADSSLLPDFKISSCIIYKEDKTGKEYLMIAYQDDAVNYLKRLVISLQEAKELKKEDINGLIGRIESFIKSL